MRAARPAPEAADAAAGRGAAQPATRDIAFPFAGWVPFETDMTAQVPVVFVVHNDAETRNHIRELAESAGLKVSAYSDAAPFLSEFPLDKPGCVVVGAQTSSMSAAELQRELVARGARIPVILAAGYAEVAAAVAALKDGAMDVIEAPLLSRHIVPAILRAIAADLGWRLRRLEHNEVQLRCAQLTPREREVMRLVVKGATSNAIARQLGISEKTVEIYRSHINKKMHVRNAVELARIMQTVE